MPVNDSEATRPPLDAAAVADLTEQWRVEVLEETASTNAVVSDRARAGEPAGLVVAAERQTAGRGRLDRTWEAPARAGLTFSVLLRPDLAPGHWPWIPLVVGLATARGVTSASGLGNVGLKWPNDLLVGGAKAGGILVERVESDQGAAAVVGIGVNVTTTRQELPVPNATSLALAGAEVDRATLLAAILRELTIVLDDLPAAFRHYPGLCETVGQDVQVSLPTGDLLRGRASGIDDGGRLVVQGDQGRVAVGAGDVVHVR